MAEKVNNTIAASIVSNSNHPSTMTHGQAKNIVDKQNQ